MSPNLYRYELCDLSDSRLSECGTDYMTGAQARKRNEALRREGRNVRWLLVDESAFEEEGRAA
jgi:hypothetical protein